MDSDWAWVDNIDPLEALDKTREYRVWLGSITMGQKQSMIEKIRKHKLHNKVYFDGFDRRNVTSIFFTWDTDYNEWWVSWMGTNYGKDKEYKNCLTKERISKDLEYFNSNEHNMIELPCDMFTITTNELVSH
jgi:hypothetical protein